MATERRGRGINGGGKRPSGPSMMGNSFHPHTMLGMADDETTKCKLDWAAALEEVEDTLLDVLAEARAFGIDTERAKIDALIKLAEDPHYRPRAGTLPELVAMPKRERDQRRIDRAAARFEGRLKSDEDHVALGQLHRTVLRRRVGARKAKQTRERRAADAAKREQRMTAARESGEITAEGTRWFLASFTHDNWGERLVRMGFADLVKDSVLLPGRYAYVKVPVVELDKAGLAEAKRHGWPVARDCWGRWFVVPASTREALRDAVSWRIEWGAPRPETEVAGVAGDTKRNKRWLPHLHSWLSDPPQSAPPVVVIPESMQARGTGKGKANRRKSKKG